MILPAEIDKTTFLDLFYILSISFPLFFAFSCVNKNIPIVNWNEIKSHNCEIKSNCYEIESRNDEKISHNYEIWESWLGSTILTFYLIIMTYRGNIFIITATFSLLLFYFTAEIKLWAGTGLKFLCICWAIMIMILKAGCLPCPASSFQHFGEPQFWLFSIMEANQE